MSFDKENPEMLLLLETFDQLDVHLLGRPSQNDDNGSAEAKRLQQGRAALND